MKALIITGGETPPEEFLRALAAQCAIVIAADSGFDAALRAELQPDLVVGDFDSLKAKSALEGLPKAKVLEYSRDKDDTDTEIAMKAAYERAASQVVLAGGGGGRMDHLLAIIRLFEGSTPPAEWHTRKESSFYIHAGRETRVSVSKNSLISVFPLGAALCEGMHSEGLRWSLDGLVWGRGQFGISNRSFGEEFVIRAGTSPLLLMLPLGGKLLS